MVNIIELAVILVGFIVAAPYALNYVGGWNGLETKIAANLGNTAKTASLFFLERDGKFNDLGLFPYADAGLLHFPRSYWQGLQCQG